MAVGFSNTNKPINPRGNDASPKGYNRASLYSGKALDFDGVNDLVTISDNAAFDFGTSDFSIAFTMDSSVAGYGRILDKRSGTNGYTLSIGTSKELVLELNDGTGSSGFFTSSIYADGKLKHVVVSADRDGNASFYINGALDETIDISSKSGNLDSTSDLFIGADAPSGNSLYYNGSIAGVKIFNTALTAAQVADLYNNPEKVVPTGVANTALKLWLPMQEGAGTTAYDGSGNGNHGTISGATYVNGVGAPVSQTAVIDWNKGSNYAIYSEELNNAAWSKFTGASVDFNQTVAPNGQTTADEVSFSASTSSRISDAYTTSTSNNKTHTVSVWAKVASGTEKFRFKCTHGGVADYFSSDITVTTEWQRFSFSQAFGATAGTGIIYALQNATDGAARDIFFWGFQLDFDSSTAGPYVRTGATAQTSPVLLPQGLTTGRDITGVNLFENVRKQGALNLDGNSWAEVHDNASLDVTDAVSVECWVNVTDGSANKMLISKWSPYADDQRSYLLYLTDGEYLRFSISSDGQNSHTVSSSQRHFGAWKHFVATYDKTTLRLYVNGAAENTAAQTAAINVGTFQVEIGRHQGDTSAISSDAIAQPRIYNRALTAAEVLQNYNSGKNTYK